eukprot:m.265651 g.265651  ORF g.265651 m.265651 type:complete len:392 (+) comp62916_c0_seq1:278-1453(+)
MLKCILFSQFDVTIGPQLVIQSPINTVSQKQFGLIDKYLITKPELSDSLLTIRTFEHPIISYPVKITGKYPRNYLLFNVAFVVNVDTDTSLFEPLVKKLAGYLRALEIEVGFIVKLDNDEALQHLQNIFDQIFVGLNRDGCCEIPVEDEAYTIIRLHLTPKDDEVKAVHPFEVPLPICDLRKLNLDDLDLTIMKILPHINGENFAKKIAVKSKVAQVLVLKALSCMVARNMIAMVPVFQFNSIYVVTGNVGRLLTDADLFRRCEVFTRRLECSCEVDRHGFFTLYSELKPRQPYWTVADFHERHNLLNLGIDLRRFMYFGVLEGILRKVNQYPVRDVSSADFAENQVTEFVPAYMLNGKHTMDEISCVTEMSSRHLKDLLDSDPYCDYFYS